MALHFVNPADINISIHKIPHEMKGCLPDQIFSGKFMGDLKINCAIQVFYRKNQKLIK